MAVTLVVETGAVVANANSYVTLAEANTYLEANIQVFDTWSALSTDDKNALLIWATRYLDQRARWNGYKTDEDSALRWPRTGVYDADNNAIGAHEIPTQLKQAVIEMARYLMVEDRAIERGTDGFTKIKVDVIELSIDANYRQSEIPNELRIFIQGLGSLWSAGHNFGRIRKA